MNFFALVFWTFCGLVGFLFGDAKGLVVGLTVGLGISLMSTLYFKND